MNLKQLIGNDGHWQINKRIAREFGLNAALLLQELIDLEDSYFSGIEFWQTYPSITKSTGLSSGDIRSASAILEKNGLLTKVNKKAKGSTAISKVAHWTLHKSNIVNLFNDKQQEPDVSYQEPDVSYQEPDVVLPDNQVDKQLNKDKQLNNINKNIKKSGDELLLDKIIEKYPGSINAKSPLLKAIKALTKEEKILSLKNLERYTKAWQGFHHNLRNYLEGKQFLDRELEKREAKSNKPDITTKSSTAHNFKNKW
jgi:hypothetical protein